MTIAAMTQQSKIDPAAAWQACLERDRSQDGLFVLAVKTTGIYCKPSCPARKPLRKNVRFYPDPQAAEEAGFRACKRCRPREADDAEDPAAEKVRAARRFLEDHLDETVTLERLGEHVGLSPWHLQRIFKEQMGLSPRQYANQRRLERVRERLRQDDDVTTALYEAGFSGPAQLYSQSDARLGMTPGRYRKGGEGVHIRYATADSAVGRLLVAATDRGVCAVLMGEDDAELAANLEREFPRATREADSAALQPWLEAVLERVEGDASHEVPLDLAGTAFQRRVWQALTEIPAGATRTYGEIAAQLGRPTAARAVAGACAKNRAAVVVPCHRVVPAGGGVGGYRWGTERKRTLLEREGAEGG
jgi:AraC family transcriptional regulator of adaptative response/methylated-DNA-[protein]-cysteine methyltransferase